MNCPKRKTQQSRLYKIWVYMKTRCHNPNSGGFHKYGAKGISVCDEWRESSRIFMEWSLSNGYRDGLSIDRIDSRGNYEPSNCRWASNHEQMQNRLKMSKPATSKFKGVSFHKKSLKWIARIRDKGKITHLGCFIDEVEAAKAYDSAAMSIFGPFAVTNFQGDSV